MPGLDRPGPRTRPPTEDADEPRPPRTRGDARAAPPTPLLAHPRVLVVEDDRTCRRSFTRTLKEAGYEVIGAEDGRQAAAVFRMQGADVIVTDVFMPRMDGVDLLISLMLENPGLPIIAITGAQADDPRIRAARRFGFVKVLEKPCSRAQLTRAVAEALNHQ